MEDLTVKEPTNLLSIPCLFCEAEGLELMVRFTMTDDDEFVPVRLVVVCNECGVEHTWETVAEGLMVHRSDVCTPEGIPPVPADLAVLAWEACDDVRKKLARQASEK
jgi:hypothetical protein